MVKRKPPRTVETLTHEEASRKNIPTAEFRSVMECAEQSPVQVAYQRRNRDLDPQLVCCGKDAQDSKDRGLIPDGFDLFRPDNLTSTRPAGEGDVNEFLFRGRVYRPGKGTFKTNLVGLSRLARADRLWPTTTGTIQHVRLFNDFGAIPIANAWIDTGTGSFTEDKVYVVQTNVKVIERCILMTTDSGDLVLDPTCGSGTSAYVAEQWGRRWITIDTSRVALALARARIMGARYPYYLLANSSEQLATAGVQQAHKEDRIAFAAVTPWPGAYICAEGRYLEGDGDSGPEKRAGLFVGPEFGTVSRPDLVAAAREAGDAGFDVLIACAFNYEAHASEFNRLGRIPVLKARMNADLHSAQDHPEGRDRRRRVGVAPQRHLTSVRAPGVGAHRRQGHQPPRRRGDEGVPGVMEGWS